jgi:hypothetical protein
MNSDTLIASVIGIVGSILIIFYWYRIATKKRCHPNSVAIAGRLYREVYVSDGCPSKSGNYICHVEVKDGGVYYLPVSYVRYDAELNKWVNPTVFGTLGEVISWFEEHQGATE